MVRVKPSLKWRIKIDMYLSVSVFRAWFARRSKECRVAKVHCLWPENDLLDTEKCLRCAEKGKQCTKWVASSGVIEDEVTRGRRARWACTGQLFEGQKTRVKARY